MKKEKTKKEKKTKVVKGWWEDFKKFISRGNVIDMAVGVVIGGAFSAIVTAVTNILLSVCTWAVPGGLNGLITILPAVSTNQKGLNEGIGLAQSFAKGDLQSLAQKLAEETYGADVADSLVESAKATITSNYTLYGGIYAYNQAAIINWGAVINAIISFLIIALTLFIILKVYNALKKKRLDFIAAEKEKYYQKHPEERPVVVKEEKKPTETELLTEIRDLLKVNAVTNQTVKPNEN